MKKIILKNYLSETAQIGQNNGISTQNKATELSSSDGNVSMVFRNGKWVVPSLSEDSDESEEQLESIRNEK